MEITKMCLDVMLPIQTVILIAYYLKNKEKIMKK